MDLLEVGEWKVIYPEDGYVIGSTNVKALDIVITRKDRVYRKLVRLNVEDKFNPKKIFTKKALANLDKVDSTKIYTANELVQVMKG